MKSLLSLVLWLGSLIIVVIGIALRRPVLGVFGVLAALLVYSFSFRRYFIHRTWSNAPRALAVVVATFVGLFVCVRAGYVAIGLVLLVLGLGFACWMSPGLVLVVLCLVTALTLSPGGTIEAIRHLTPRDQVSAPLEEDRLLGRGGDRFVARIRNRAALNDMLKEAAKQYKGDASESSVEALLLFLLDLYKEILKSLTQPKSLGPMMAEVFVLGAGSTLGWRIAERMLRQLGAFCRRKENRPAQALAEEAEKVLSYFKVVHRSRIAEIAQATKLPKERVSCLLKLLPLDHEPGCYWSLATQSTGAPITVETRIVPRRRRPLWKLVSESTPPDRQEAPEDDRRGSGVW